MLRFCTSRVLSLPFHIVIGPTIPMHMRTVAFDSLEHTFLNCLKTFLLNVKLNQYRILELSVSSYEHVIDRSLPTFILEQLDGLYFFFAVRNQA